MLHIVNEMTLSGYITMKYITILTIFTIIHSIIHSIVVNKINNKLFRIIVYITIGSIFIYIYGEYFMEPIRCCAPNPNGTLSTQNIIDGVNATQTSNFRALADLMENRMNRELDRRGAIGARSPHVTLSDIGINFRPTNMAFPDYPGLASLYILKPEWFTNRGQTHVTHLIAHIRADL